MPLPERVLHVPEGSLTAESHVVKATAKVRELNSSNPQHVYQLCPG
jgi:hypothetical protein